MPSPEYLQFIIAIIWCIVGFGSYYALSNSIPLSRQFANLSHHLDAQGNQVILQRGLGLLFLGLFPVLLISLLPGKSLQEFGMTFKFEALPPWWFWLLFPLILVMSYYSARSDAFLKKYPQIRAGNWTPAMLRISAISWVLFLLGYEFLFRGLVLFASLEIMGPVPAIALNTFLYALAHFYKGQAEIVGTIPAGIIFCYVTVLTGNIWCAVIMHMVMALSNEWFSLMAHPEMSFTKNR